MKKRTNIFLTFILITGLLLGFSQPVVNADSIPAPTETTVTETSTTELKNLIQQFREEGEITNQGIARALNQHVTALERFADQEKWDKAVHHTDGFVQYILQQEKVGHISENASTTLQNHAFALKIEWATVYDSDQVMDTIKHLSVDIGPRVAGSEEEKQAADYLKNRFEDYGYDVSIQEFDIRDTVKIQLTINENEELALGQARGSSETDENGVTGNIIDAGLGHLEDFPENTNGNIALIQKGEITDWEKVENAQNSGAIGVVIYDNEERLSPVRPNLNNNESTIPVVGIQKVDGEALITQLNEGEVNANLYVRTQTNQTSQNVIATKKPENVTNPEIVYITAHYDSVPFSPGANDDGSGTSTVVELARIMKDFPTDKELRFIAFGAEEIGLVGSTYYVSQLSEDEINRSAVNFQLEMMGAKYEPGSYLAYNTVDGQKNLIWDYTEAAFDKLGYDKEKLILFKRGSSDHVPFHNAGITAACFNMGTANGGLEPEYHTPYDSFENVSQERIEFAGQIVKSAIINYLVDHASNDMQEAS